MGLWGGGPEDAISNLETQMQGTQAMLDPALKNFLAMLSGATGAPTLPGIPQDVLSQLMAQYSIGAEELTKRIGQQSDQMLGDLAAKTATQGITGSSAHGRAVGQIGTGASDALSTGLTELERSRMSDMLAIRNALLGAQTSNFGTLGSSLSGMYGANMGGYNALANLYGAEAQQNTGLLGMLGQLGGGAVGLADLFLNRGKTG